MLARGDAKVRGRLCVNDVVPLTSPRAERISGPEKSRSSARKDFCISIGTFRTSPNLRRESVMRTKAGVRRRPRIYQYAALRADPAPSPRKGLADHSGHIRFAIGFYQ